MAFGNRSDIQKGEAIQLFEWVKSLEFSQNTNLVSVSNNFKLDISPKNVFDSRQTNHTTDCSIPLTILQNMHETRVLSQVHHQDCTVIRNVYLADIRCRVLRITIKLESELCQHCQISWFITGGTDRSLVAKLSESIKEKPVFFRRCHLH